MVKRLVGETPETGRVPWLAGKSGEQVLGYGSGGTSDADGRRSETLPLVACYPLRPRVVGVGQVVREGGSRDGTPKHTGLRGCIVQPIHYLLLLELDRLCHPLVPV